VCAHIFEHIRSLEDQVRGDAARPVCIHTHTYTCRWRRTVDPPSVPRTSWSSFARGVSRQ
jgi:hypothetical protein